jgi:hypothetical protein
VQVMVCTKQHKFDWHQIRIIPSPHHEWSVPSENIKKDGTFNMNCTRSRKT